MFKKMVIADNISIVVKEIWEFQDTLSSSTLIVGAILYSFQMYADFSGYSDMAIGVGKLLGFRITENFRYPFFAKNIAAFWRNWHISLTSWLTDYVFMPLNVKYRNWRNWGTILAIIITFVLIGLWHGANWTFAVFGLYHGLLFIPLMLSGAFFKKTKLKTTKLGLPTFLDFFKMLGTFLLVTLGLIIFRADNIGQAYTYISNSFSSSILSIPKIVGYANITMILTFVFIIILLVYEWRNRDKEYGLEISHKKIGWQYFHYAFMMFMIYFLGSSDTSSFIYFQF
jgi:D-alanyl-lipoteichoic acid acyltransferase DltB (MBOAT superfamily)